MSGLGILLSLGLLVYCYWNSPLQLLRYCYTLFLLFALAVAARHLWFRLAGPLKATFGKKEQENGEAVDFRGTKVAAIHMHQSCTLESTILVCVVYLPFLSVNGLAPQTNIVPYYSTT